MDEQAMACYRRALELKPTYAEAHNHLGNLLQQQGQLEQAEMHYQRALEFKPNYGEAHFNQSLLMLLSGQFQDGWREYEWRWKAGQVPERRFSQPRWDGRSLGDRPILLYAEQGLGDTIQFARYAALVKSRRANVWLECPASLVPLMATCHGVARVIGYGVELPPFEVQAPLLSLPGIFGTTLETIPAEVPYLFADPAIVEEWRSKLQHIRGYRVGINWHGRGTQHVLRERHIELDFFALLAQVPGVQLISLQHGEGRKEMRTVGERFALIDPGDDFDSTRGAFMDTAAMMMNLDLVITSDTAIAHLAGALGVSVWVALPIMADWRWLLDREDSPWYPTMRLFRQRKAGDWRSVFQDIHTALRNRLGERGRSN